GTEGASRVFGAEVGADLQADVSAGDVVEPCTVQGADLHVFDRLGLYGKIGILCSRNRNETSCGNEEKTFHHLHCCSSVFTSVGGLVFCGSTCPKKVPYLPRTTRNPNQSGS